MFKQRVCSSKKLDETDYVFFTDTTYLVKHSTHYRNFSSCNFDIKVIVRCSMECSIEKEKFKNQKLHQTILIYYCSSHEKNSRL